jgi:hypothetical protein
MKKNKRIDFQAKIILFLRYLIQGGETYGWKSKATS